MTAEAVVKSEPSEVGFALHGPRRSAFAFAVANDYGVTRGGGAVEVAKAR